ncbi:MAG: hypothetical protein ABI726_03250 [bacterium]
MGDEDLRSANPLQACRRKRRFETEREADDAAYRAKMEGRTLGVYQCEWCGGWHLTSRPPQS